MRKAKSISKSKPKEKVEVWIKREVYGQAPEEQHFVLSSGDKLKDLKDLLSAIENMSNEVFTHHVNETKNDFSNWVNDVFKDEDLAKELKKLNSKIETELALHKHVIKKMENAIKKLARRK